MPQQLFFFKTLFERVSVVRLLESQAILNWFCLFPISEVVKEVQEIPEAWQPSKKNTQLMLWPES